MAKSEQQLTTKIAKGSPYQLDTNQVEKAAKALVSHLQTETAKQEQTKSKKSLLADEDSSDAENEQNDTPVYLILGTKKHIQDSKRLKPSKIPLPHPISVPSARVCLITADPQRAYKDLVAESAFPSTTSSKITRVLGMQKLKARYKTYESRRQLVAEYDVFLADDRIISYLPGLLGKVFYASTTKRPIPVDLVSGTEKEKDSAGKKVKSQERKVGAPQAVATEIETALNSALVNLSPSVTTSVKVAMASMTPQQIVENVQVVVSKLTDSFVPQGWRGVRNFLLKGPNSMSLPIWLADELWQDEDDVLDEKRQPRTNGSKGKNETKRKWEEWEDELLDDEDKAELRRKRRRKSKADKESAAKTEKALAKENRRKLKEDVLKAIEAPPITNISGVDGSKKSKKSKLVAA